MDISRNCTYGCFVSAFRLPGKGCHRFLDASECWGEKNKTHFSRESERSLCLSPLVSVPVNAVCEVDGWFHSSCEQPWMQSIQHFVFKFYFWLQIADHTNTIIFEIWVMSTGKQHFCFFLWRVSSSMVCSRWEKNRFPIMSNMCISIYIYFVQ